MKRKSFRRALSAVLSLALLLVLPGCGEDQGSVTGPGVQTAPPAATATPGASAPTPPPLPSYAPPEEYPAYTGQWEDTDEPLSICIPDAWTESDRQSFQELVQVLTGTRAQLAWVVIPGEADLAEAVMQQLRLDLMAGGGPDLFLLPCYQALAQTPPPVLFSQPEKALWQGLFLPLDGLLENPRYLEPEDFNKAVLSAGRTPEGQVALPLTYDYSVAVLSGEELAGERPPAAWDQAVSGESRAARLVAGGVPSFHLYHALGRLADYETEELAFSQEQLLEWTRAFFDARRAPERPAVNGGLGSAVAADLPADASLALVPLPNVQSGFTASVTSFVAVNRNTKQAGNAMLLVDLLLSPGFLSGEGVRIGDQKAGYDRYYCAGLLPRLTVKGGGGLPIARSALARSLHTSAANAALYRGLEEKITAVRFASALDQPLFDLALRSMSYLRTPDEEALRAEVSSAYGMLRMLLAE